MIYSPSQSKTFLECPTKRMLNQEGWTERVVGIRDWAAWIGQGVHAGLAHFMAPRPGITYNAPSPTGVVANGQDEFVRQYDHAIKSGRIIPGHLFYVGEAKAHIERCLEYAMKNDLLPTGFEVERVEQSLGDYNCILDVVGKRNGKPTFIDWKIKTKLKPEYVEKELERYRYDWKEARHYPWALSEVCGQRVEEYTVVIFVLGPQFRVVQRTYQVNWKVVERWAQGNISYGPYVGLWSLMEGEYEGAEQHGIEVLTTQSNQCHPAMGFPCEYLDACWAYDLDREKMRTGGLIQVQRIDKQIVAGSQQTEQERA